MDVPLTPIDGWIIERAPATFAATPILAGLLRASENSDLARFHGHFRAEPNFLGNRRAPPAGSPSADDGKISTHLNDDFIILLAARAVSASCQLYLTRARRGIYRSLGCTLVRGEPCARKTHVLGAPAKLPGDFVQSHDALTPGPKMIYF